MQREQPQSSVTMIIPSNLLTEAVNAVAGLSFRDAATVLANLRQPLTLQHGCVHLVTFQEAWCDVSFWWEPVAACPPQRRCTDPEYTPLCGGRLVRYCSSIGD